MYILIDLKATSVFINKSFVEKHYLNTYKLSTLIPIYNVNRTPNKTGLVLKIVDIVLWYKNTYKVNFACSLKSKQAKSYSRVYLAKAS